MTIILSVYIYRISNLFIYTKSAICFNLGLKNYFIPLMYHIQIPESNHDCDVIVGLQTFLMPSHVYITIYSLGIGKVIYSSLHTECSWSPVHLCMSIPWKQDKPCCTYSIRTAVLVLGSFRGSIVVTLSQLEDIWRSFEVARSMSSSVKAWGQSCFCWGRRLRRRHE